ncbi:methyltransferase domain-containing protein [Streptomyces sp. SID8374]|uniref:class I SAM-dependent methyltransferase n=1 Tax=unclassified Streptomyces TaxID=2593676 RepID=UPI00081D3E22|nr:MULTISPECIES: class I SAM-dependent methyltransferase [unclassified Streptomyces]MYR94008.1 methyltransferase domain-containing protein [Streptomyces sp. SID4937]MYX13772.1 methyltransferase domain-containing protein [Streptomyces sp. SID8374]SCD63550.1 Methyltransferase domain-containing protein [Streptomyces sp. ScaeMP-e83]
MDRNIRTTDDVMTLLDDLFAPEAHRWTADAGSWWDGFYGDRSKPVPFFVDKPDENLVSYVDRGLVAPGRALDLGCGPGRNTHALASLGFDVDAIDLSPAAIAWAEERAEASGIKARFHRGDAFVLTSGGAAGADEASGAGGAELAGPYDLIHDSGCFHHLPPHRRISYLALLDRCLAPGGHFTLTCFAAGEGGMGSELPDAELYRRGDLGGGLAYTSEELRDIFSGLEEIELRRMRDEAPGSPVFGESFLWAALFRKAPRP